MPKEKMTDVNIALSMVRDAHANLFDIALLVSGDADLRPALDEIRSIDGDKSIYVAFPPKRKSLYLESVADASFVIPRTAFRDSQLPESVTKQGGIVLSRPTMWK
jgi:uncharacterized LabA/DUF88 family protein